MDAFLRKNIQCMSKIPNTLFKNVKRVPKIPERWRVAAVPTIYNKGDRKCVNNYRPVSLLDIEIIIFEKHKTLQPLLLLPDNPPARLCKQSIGHNENAILPEKKHEALDEDPDSEILAFYTDFSKASEYFNMNS